MVLSKGDAPADSSNYQLDLREASSNGAARVHFEFKTGGKFRNIKTSSQSAVVINQWQHVVAVYDPDGGIKKIYVNAVDLAITDSSNDDDLTVNNLDFNIGNRGAGLGSTEAFDGVIDEVRIYNRALSGAEVAELYAFGAAATARSQALIIA